MLYLHLGSNYWENFSCVMQIARNITTNEVANSSRYGYLRGPDGKFRNPYNHGCWKNCSDFVFQGYTDDNDIAWPPLQQVASQNNVPRGTDTSL